MDQSHHLSNDELQSLVAGALHDFVGYLTTRPQTIQVGAAEVVYPLHNAFLAWAAERKLQLEDPDTEGWAERIQPR